MWLTDSDNHSITTDEIDTDSKTEQGSSMLCAAYPAIYSFAVVIQSIFTVEPMTMMKNVYRKTVMRSE
jgi:hypothetical protein